MFQSRIFRSIAGKRSIKNRIIFWFLDGKLMLWMRYLTEALLISTHYVCFQRKKGNDAKLQMNVRYIYFNEK